MNTTQKGWKEIEAGEEKMKTKHTPTPWAVERDVMAQGVCHLAITARHAGKDWMPCSITPMDSMRPIDEANARFICKAVNCHDQLVGALKAIHAASTEHADLGAPMTPECVGLISKWASNAIAKAKGEL